MLRATARCFGFCGPATCFGACIVMLGREVTPEGVSVCDMAVPLRPHSYVLPNVRTANSISIPERCAAVAVKNSRRFIRSSSQFEDGGMQSIHISIVAALTAGKMLRRVRPDGLHLARIVRVIDTPRSCFCITRSP